MNKIHSLWIGEYLSIMERLSIVSHLKVGHEYHLWTYAPLEVPEGVILEDGNEILPEPDIFCYSGPSEEGGGSVSAFSNWFRYKLLLERGGWWCDTDVVALKPFNFNQEYVIASERPRPWREDEPSATTCVIKSPAGSKLMQYCWESCQSIGKDVSWGVVGPKLLTESVSENHLSDAVVPSWVFCPLDWWQYEEVFLDTPVGKSYAVHLWNEMWRRDGIDKDATFDDICLYERLKNAIFSNTR